MKLIENLKINQNKSKKQELLFFTIPIIRHVKNVDNESKEEYVEIFPRKSLRTEFFNRILNFLRDNNVDFDDLYIARMNIGETVLLAGLIKEWIKLNKSQKPIVILTQNYHKTIFDMFCPDIKNIYYPIGKAEMDVLLHQTTYLCKKHKINYFYPIKYGLFAKKNIHFSDFLKKLLKVKEYQYNIQKTQNPDLPEKFLSTGINIDKFVIISPEATSCKVIDNNFWTSIIKQINLMGYSVFVNVKEPKQKIEGAFYLHLSLFELYSISKYAKAIIGTRSGLFDFLAIIDDLPMHVIYSDITYWGIKSQNVLNSYSLKKLPYIKNKYVYEYDVNQFDINDFVTNIKKTLVENNYYE